MVNLLPITLLALIWGSAISCSLAAYDFMSTYLGLSKYVAMPIGLVAFVLSFCISAGLASLTAQSGIKKGIFPREPMHPVYFRRRVYGLCWTQIFYFKPLYSIVLAVPVLRTSVLRLFGYRGKANFITYPDTWIRDLPLLQLQTGAYLSNKATIGTNICLANGNIYVDKVAVGEKALIGHLSMIAPGVTIEDGAEIGVGSAIGIRSRVKKKAKIDPTCAVSHGVVIGERVEIGAHSHIGMRAVVGDDLKIPAGSDIPGGTVLRTQDDVERHTKVQNQKLGHLKEDILHVLRSS